MRAGRLEWGEGSLADARAGGTIREWAEVWQRETHFLSFMEQRAMHPAYQRIVGLGWVAVPLVLRELQRQPEH